MGIEGGEGFIEKNTRKFGRVTLLRVLSVTLIHLCSILNAIKSHGNSLVSGDHWGPLEAELVKGLMTTWSASESRICCSHSGWLGASL